MYELKTATSTPFYRDFRPLNMEAGGVRFAGVIGGNGPPVLLLHGYPQTHIAWRRVAPALALTHTVITPDLPGYGLSQIRQTTPRWTKRRVGNALIALMEKLGHRRFSVVGHDRGARAGYRMALDHPERITAFASLTVVPTLDALASMDFRGASKAFHWFLLAQQADLPERLLAADPDAFIDFALEKMTEGREVIEAAAMQAYRAAFRRPSVRLAMIEDYRAALDEDLAMDEADFEAGRKLSCPVLVLWPETDHADNRPAPIEVWRRWATNVTGSSTRGGHLQQEDAPEQVLASLVPFLRAQKDP